MLRTIASALFLVASGPLAMAEALLLNFHEVSAASNVLAVQGSGNAAFAYAYMPFLEWKEKHAGKFFPMAVAPVLSGAASGGVLMPEPKGVDASKYRDQAAEFANVVNFRNQGGRSTIEAKLLPPQTELADEEAGTYVVQTVLGTVLDRPLSQLKLSSENFVALAESTDVDHYHFQIPGTFVLEALEKDHIAARALNLNGNYLLSVIDFRDYACAVMKDGIRDYFSKLPDKQKLMNESIYMISQVDLNNPADLAQAEKYFARRPDALLSQQVIYSDHLIRGARSIFAFFSEGEKTKVVLVSNIGMKSKFFVGVKGAITRQYILNGIGGGVRGTVLSTKDQISDLLSGATADVNSKNTCSRGLARGLIKYSQELFSGFANYIMNLD